MNLFLYLNLSLLFLHHSVSPQSFENSEIFSPLKNVLIRLIYFENSPTTHRTLSTLIAHLELRQCVFILNAEPAEKDRLRTTQFKDSKLHNLFQIPWKFLSSYVILILQDDLISHSIRNSTFNSQALYLSTLLTYPMIYLRNENPRTVIFYTEYIPRPEYYTKLADVDITCTYYVKSLKNEFILCPNCYDIILFKLPDENNNLNWRKVQKLYGATIPIVNLKFKQWDFGFKCDIFKQKLSQYSQDGESCFLNVVRAQYLNISDGFDILGQSVTASMTSLFVDNVNILFPQLSGGRFEILPWGMSIDTFSFGTVISPGSNYRKLGSLSKPFDLYTWILLFGSLMAIYIFLKFVL